MADRLIIDADASLALRMLDMLGEKADPVCKAVSMETAAAIDREATARVRRREGVTARNIVHTDHLPEYLGGDPSTNPTAAFVYVEAKQRPNNIAIWLNFGTKYMAGDDFMFSATRLEEGPHLRRLNDALTELCEDLSGLGE